MTIMEEQIKKLITYWEHEEDILSKWANECQENKRFVELALVQSSLAKVKRFLNDLNSLLVEYS